jgi:peroxiredoxin
MARRIALLISCAIALVACGSTASGTTPVEATGTRAVAVESRIVGETGQAGIPEVGTPAPDFEYTFADGTTRKLSDLRGKKVLINFWATWCAPCRLEMPDLQKALAEVGDSAVVLGVNKAEQAEVIGPFADELGVSFPLIANPNGDIASRYAAQLLPTSYFINSDGTIGLRKTGVMNYSFIKTHLDQLK